MTCFWCGNPSEPPVHFPKNTYLQKQWLLAMKMDANTAISEQHSLCKEHFNEKEYLAILSNETILHYGALPYR